MKKMLFLMVLCFFCILPISIFAAESNQNNIIDAGLKTVLMGQLSEDERAILYDKTIYKDKVDIDNKTIIKTYDSILPWSECHLPLDELVLWAESINKFKYIVLNEKNTNIRITEGEKGVSVVTINTILDYKSATFAQDIKSMGVMAEIMNEQCEIRGIYCFDTLSSYSGFFAYYDTDKGVFVKFYENERSQGTWFREQDFSTYGTAYYKYITSYEYNYDEDGNPLYGGTSFEKYIKEIYGTEKDYGVHGTGQKPQTNQSGSVGQKSQISSANQDINEVIDDINTGSQNSQKDKNIDENSEDNIVVGIVITVLVVIAVGISVVIICKKRNR